MKSGSSITGWAESPVTRGAGYFEIRFDPRDRDSQSPAVLVALVGPPRDGIVDVEIALDASNPDFDSLVAECTREIEFYLVDKGEPDAWRYAQYHCGTMSNVYSSMHWRYAMPDLEQAYVGFGDALASHPGFGRRSFSASELLRDPKWDWGYDHGVYCFIANGEVAYVGRALGSTLGERLWDQLRSTSDPAWAAVVNGDDTRIEVFTVDREHAFLGAALEAYLIDALNPDFNSRIT